MEKETLYLSADIGVKQKVNVLVCGSMRARYKFCDIYVERDNSHNNKVICKIDFIIMDELRRRKFISDATDRFLKCLSKYEGVSYVKATTKK